MSRHYVNAELFLQAVVRPGYWLPVALALLLAAIVTIPAAEATTFPPQGGKGDRGFETVCPPGHYIVGFHGGTGAWVDRIGITCAPFNMSGGMDPAKSYGTAGGPGGAQTVTKCGPRAVATQIYLRLTPDRQVRNVGFNCQTREGQAGMRTFGPTAEKGDPAHTFVCPETEMATGIHGRVGKHVNSIGLICGPSYEFFGSGLVQRNTDRPGRDYKRLEESGARNCQVSCYKDGSCKAWTYVNPGLQGPSGICWLKNATPGPVANSCCTSGLSGR